MGAFHCKPNLLKKFTLIQLRKESREMLILISSLGFGASQSSSEKYESASADSHCKTSARALLKTLGLGALALGIPLNLIAWHQSQASAATPLFLRSNLQDARRSWPSTTGLSGLAVPGTPHNAAQTARRAAPRLSELSCVQGPGTPFCPASIVPASPLTADVAMCVVARDEIDFDQWKEHYEALGVGAFYIKDHNGTVPLLQSSPSLGLATNVDYEYFNEFSGTQWPQTAAYNECLRRYGKQHKAMAFFDVDEFLVLLNGETSLVQFLKEFEPFGALAVNWELFGSSNHVKRPKGKIVENYTQCYPADHPSCHHVKVIVNPAHVNSTGLDPHTFIYHEGMTAVNEHKEPIFGPLTPTVSKDRVVLNHYVTKSWEDFEDKMKRGAAHGATKTEEFFNGTNSDATAQCDAAIRFPAGG